MLRRVVQIRRRLTKFLGAPFMDRTLVDSIRKSLEAKSTAELRQAHEGGDQSGRPPEELEALRQVLDERRRKGIRFALAIGSAVVGVFGGVGTWWQLGPDPFVLLFGVVCAVLGFVCWYVPC